MQTNNIDLTSRVAIVTGAARGIGYAICERLLQSGASVSMWDLDGAALRSAGQALAGLGKVAIEQVEVSDPDSVARATQSTANRFGKVDILVNNAGIGGPIAPVWEYDLDAFRQVFDVNVVGVFLCCKAVVPLMRKQNYGRIVNIASIAGKNGTPNFAPYGASKAAVIALTKALGRELADTEILANAVCPSADTRMTLTEAVKANRKRKFEEGLMTKAEYERTLIPRGPEFIAPMVVYLCLDQADYINGQVFHVEKGRINTYYFGEDLKSLHKGGDGMFDLDELIEDVPTSLMNGITPVVPPVRMAEAVKAGDTRKVG